MSEEGYKVTLHAYDLSQGLARQLSTSFLGKSIEAIWHTGIVVYGNEYYFGAGIQSDPVGRTPYGTPLRVIDLGVTHVPKDVFEMYLQEINPRYTAQTYSLLTHNCNNFSNEVAQFLVGSSIPDYILNLPNEVMSSPMGAMMLPMIQNLEMSLRAGAVPQAPQFRPSAAVASSIQTGSTANKSTGSSASITPTLKAEVEDSGEKTRVESAADGITRTNDKAQPGNPSDKAVTKDPLGDARDKIQEEITKEFAAIMQSGMYRASEAAALATRRVMERHGHMNTARS